MPIYPPGEPPITKQARQCYPGGNLPVYRIVIHDEEHPVSDTSAEGVADYFAGPTAAGAAHYVEDADSEQHCVADASVAYHAPPNAHSLGIEQDGYARFTADEWALPGSQATIRRTAARAAELLYRYGLPVHWITVAELVADPATKGVTDHATVTAAFHQSTHTDPGPDYPRTQFMAWVAEDHAAYTGTTPTPRRPRMFLAHPDDRATVYVASIGDDNKVKALPLEDPTDRDAFVKAGFPLVEVKASTWQAWGGA